MVGVYDRSPLGRLVISEWQIYCARLNLAGGRGTGIQHSPGAPAQLSELARNLADKSALQEAKSDPALLDKEICT